MKKDNDEENILLNDSDGEKNRSKSTKSRSTDTMGGEQLMGPILRRKKVSFFLV